jgi:transcriptional regulator with XRE-family HTH domain
MERAVTPLKVAVVASGRRQKDIAAALGMTEAQFSLIVNGKHADHGTQERIAAELRQKVEVLFPPAPRVDPFSEEAA